MLDTDKADTPNGFSTVDFSLSHCLEKITERERDTLRERDRGGGRVGILKYLAAS